MTAPKSPVASEPLVKEQLCRVVDLNSEQRRRAASLLLAKTILGPSANVMTVINVARWINNGAAMSSSVP